MAQPPTIKTKRLLVRAFKDDDVEGLTSVFNEDLIPSSSAA